MKALAKHWPHIISRQEIIDWLQIPDFIDLFVVDIQRLQKHGEIDFLHIPSCSGV
jgi:hypothetical protein